MPHKQHSLIDSDPHFSIDVASKSITNKSHKKIILVKGAHKSEIFTFDIPRKIEGHDMLLCDKVQVHYSNIGNNAGELSEDVYEVKDFKASEVDDAIAVFSWCLEGNATKYAGSLNFSLWFYCTNGDIINYSWGTVNYIGITVSDSNNNSKAVIEHHSDIVTEWMHGIEQSIDGTVTDAVNKAVEEDIRESVDKAVEETVGVAVDKAVDDALKDSAVNASNYANAIKANVSGTSITIDDLSPLTSKLKVKVVGKQPPEAPAALMMMRSAAPAATGDELVNLMPYPYADGGVGTNRTVGGITYYVNEDGSITVSGVASGISQFSICKSYTSLSPFEIGKWYTKYAVPDGISLQIISYDSNKNETPIIYPSALSGNVADSAVGCTIRLSINKGTDLSNGVTVYPMIVEDQDVAITEYVPPQGLLPDGGDHTHIDADKDHFCDICGERLSACVDNDKDHFCDYCLETMWTEHGDADKDHYCDLFGKDCTYGTFGVHEDKDGDGLCDYCGQPMEHTCADNNNDHLCDTCGKKLTECVDADNDHYCDICGAKMSEHEDADMDHDCDYCGGILGAHVDNDGDGKCDYCGEPMHTCKDANNDHLCDICGKRLSECVDNDLDHDCDICGAIMDVHADHNKDHKCDYCGGTGFGVHADDNGDGYCDYCGEPIIAVTLKIASADDPDTIIKTIKTTYGAIVELTPIFPSMVITTDSDDAILSAEYNKDTNAVIAKLREAIGEGGGVTDADKEEIKAEIKAYVYDAILGGAW